MFSLQWISYINICRWLIAFLTDRYENTISFLEHARPIMCIVCSIAINLLQLSSSYFSLQIPILNFTPVVKIFLKSKAKPDTLHWDMLKKGFIILTPFPVKVRTFYSHLFINIGIQLLLSKRVVWMFMEQEMSWSLLGCGIWCIDFALFSSCLGPLSPQYPSLLH